MKAVRIQKQGQAGVENNVKVPSLRPDYILVKVRAVALNPTDWKHIGFTDANVTLGCDYAGVVEEVGSDVTKPFKKGDRVYGVVHGANLVQPEDGSFGEYLVAKGDLQLKIPDNLSFEEAATLGMGIATVGQGWQALGLPLPDHPAKEKFPILIYGGSSAMGAYGIQYAIASGLEVITTASPRNFDYVKSLGATHAYDYKEKDVGATIRKLTDDKLIYAWDAIGEHGSPGICADALASKAPASGSIPGADGKVHYATVLFDRNPREKEDGFESVHKLMYTTFGEEFTMANKSTPPIKEDFEFMKKFVAISEKLIADGKVKPHQYEVRDGGLDGVLSGLDDMKNGRISAKKLVYTVA